MVTTMAEGEEGVVRRPRVLVSHFGTPMFVDAVRILQDRGFDIVYWDRLNNKSIGKKNSRDDLLKKEFPHTIFHIGLDAQQGVPPKDIDISKFEPADETLLKKLHSCESQVLTMMKIEDLDNKIPVFKKKHIYYQYVKYWYGVLTSQKIDAVLSVHIPHLSFRFVIYHLCKILGVKFLMLVPTVGARYLISEDIEDYKKVRDEYQKTISGTFSSGDLSSDLREYYKSQTNLRADATPFYIKKGVARHGDYVWNRPRLGSLLKNAKSFTLLWAMYKCISLYAKFLFTKHQMGELEPFWYRGYALKARTMRWKMYKERIKKRYQELQKDADFSKRFVYVPLHIQPECTTSAMGGVFVDQILMIDILSSALPEGWFLYVKENPGQWSGPKMHVGRFHDYYDDILKRKNVRLIPIETSTYALIENAEAVATVTGTVAREAVFRGKPALVFGYVWFMYCEGIFRVESVPSARDAFQKIQEGYKPDRQKVLNFLVAFDRVSFRGFHSRRWKVGQNLAMSESENARNIARAFYEEFTGKKYKE